ncbi:MAG TPA: hypothetical protein VK988_17270, partial [Acidimicrobiales bacterium]|nr:hypothetical protein [Acidimicrobiales bacterium]
MDPAGIEALAARVRPATGEVEVTGWGGATATCELTTLGIGENHAVGIVGVSHNVQLTQVVETVMSSTLCRPPDYADFRFQTLVVQGERDAAVGIIRGRQGRRGGCRELGIDPA